MELSLNNSVNELSEWQASSHRTAHEDEAQSNRYGPVPLPPRKRARTEASPARTDRFQSPPSISHQKRSRSPEAEERRRKAISSKPEAEKMKTFDPWPVFFRREWRRNWPFLTGFAITGFLITKMTANFTEEDLKNSKFVQEHKRH
ncbi:uncharacterized protein LOC8079369 [Sorghum bicolor]|jgi:large subunit ribosomal protein L28|nr:uncharacterized protein LOC8079369 [Sorghum bicolor]|eukprot:XP_002461077.2 uncharacterized protein LOC8079369 [Sorghum bicolor]